MRGAPKRLVLVALALLAAAGAATPASARELGGGRVSVASAVDRDCTKHILAGGNGYATRELTMPDTGWITARLDGSSTGDWDLGIFDRTTGRLVAGSSSFGADEVATGLAAAKTPLVVQACRRSGAGRRASLAIESQAIAKGEGDKASLVKVSTPNHARERQLLDLGLDLTEHGGKGYVSVVLHGADDAKKLRKANFNYVQQIGDLAAQNAKDRAADARYANKVQASALPSKRTTYRTLNDYTAEMKQLVKDNPNLVKPITLAHKTYEGRTVEGIEITSNVNAFDSKPVFMQLGVHHAREWPSGEHVMEWAYELVNGYKSGNARVRRIVDGERTILIPIVNPDGFNMSRTAGGVSNGRGNPPGSPAPPAPCTVDTGPVAGQVDCETANILAAPPGEYRRKNCRLADDSPQGSCAQGSAGLAEAGVDPNRNYGSFWGGPGASTDFKAQDYRGPGPFSEPETQNIRELVSRRQVTGLITNHTFSNLVLRPPGVRQLGLSPDEGFMKSLGDSMASENGYSSQFGWQLYDTSGTTEDWSYYQTGGFGYTFEIGFYNFHPPFQDVVNEYEGNTAFSDHDGHDGHGNREAYFKASEAALDTAHHSLLAGAAPHGILLRVDKRFKSLTSQVIGDDGTLGAQRALDEHVDTITEIPSSDRVRWHINPSTRPISEKSIGRQPNGPVSAPVSFSGGPGPSALPCADFETTDETCWNDHPFTVPAGGFDNDTASIKVNWTTQASDWDMKIFVDSNGDGSSVGETQKVGESGTGPGNFEHSLVPSLVPGGKYVIRMQNFAAAEPYNGTITFLSPVFYPAQRENWNLSCETFGGKVLSRTSFFVARGASTSAGLAACSAAVARAFKTCRGADKPTGKVRGRLLDRARLGRDRLRHLRTYKLGRRGRRNVDRFCLSDRRLISIGYPTAGATKGFSRAYKRRLKNKAIFIITSSKHFKIKKVKVGAKLKSRTTRKRLGKRRFRVGRNVWYLRKGSRSRLIFKTHRGRVTAIGIGDKRLTSTKKRAKRYLKSFR